MSQAADGRPGLRLMAHDDQPAGGVVDAIAVLAPGDRVEGVLEEECRELVQVFFRSRRL